MSAHSHDHGHHHGHHHHHHHGEEHAAGPFPWRRMGWAALLVLFALAAASLVQVRSGEATVITRFGNPSRVLLEPGLGWRWLFYIGGIVTLLFVAWLWSVLPESPRYLAERPDRAAELDRILRRIGHPDPASAAHVPLAAGEAPRYEPMRNLFGPALLRDTLALAVAMFSGMFMIYLMFNWAPTMLTSAGFGLQTASLGLTSFNMGGTIGAMIASLAIIRFGSRPVLILMAIVGAAVCATLALLPISGGRNEAAVLACLGALGLFASAAQSAMFAVGAHAFPTGLRARGLGLMGASGRVGAIVSAIAGALLIDWGNLGFFGALAALMLVNALGFIAVRGHVPALARKDAL